ncbi:hypothetical protein [Silvanigrella sp.]|jgi:hypothetical protein|uniref:hypothetical protein n=1 Tax=Silvanigrella sp. TaxID=2024976 RepID=UPI0037C6B4A6
MNIIPNYINFNIISKALFLLINEIFEKSTDSKLYSQNVCYKLNYKELVEYFFSLKSNNWLSENSKNNAEIKLNKIKFQIVKPNNFNNWNLENLIKMRSSKYYSKIFIFKDSNYSSPDLRVNNQMKLSK